MIIDWDILVKSLGKTEISEEFIKLNHVIGEFPKISEDPIEYNDPIGHTKYYEYLDTGIEIGFRQNRLNHIHIFLKKYDDYQAFEGTLIYGIEPEWDESKVISLLGKPYLSGGNIEDKLLGYINHWIKYNKEDYSLRFEFLQNGSLCQITFMLDK